MLYINRMDNYNKYMNADESGRMEIRNEYSDENMFNSMLEYNRIHYRKKSYPQIEEQLDMIYKYGLEHWRVEIEKIKARYNELPGYTHKYEDNRIKILQAELQAEKTKVTTLETQFTDLLARVQTLESA